MPLQQRYVMLTQGCCLVIIGSWSETNQRKQVPQLQEPDVKGYDPHLERTLQVSLCLLCCALLAGCNSIQTSYVATLPDAADDPCMAVGGAAHSRPAEARLA